MRCGAGAGRGAGANCADAPDENVSAASTAMAIWGEQEQGIVSPVRAQVSLCRSYPNRRKKEIFLR
jgi:hypothetical protein